MRPWLTPHESAYDPKGYALRGIAKHANHLIYARKGWTRDGRDLAQQNYLLSVGTSKFMLGALARDYREACGRPR